MHTSSSVSNSNFQLRPERRRLAGFEKLTTALLLTAIINSSILPAFAALTDSDIMAAINKAEFLAPGTQVRVKVGKDQVYVSTYRHSDDEKDCKIDAALISKAVFETAPDELARVTIQFYGKDVADYQEVSISAGDIKSFANGSVGKEQFLSSLTIRKVSTQNVGQRVQSSLESNYISRATDYKISEDKDSITVTTALDAWISDEDSKLEALRIAMNTFRVQPGVQQVKVVFTDPYANGENREIVFATSSLESTWRAIQTSLSGLQIARRAPVFDLQTLQTAKGVWQKERDALLAELKDMDKKGIGIAPFVKIFLGIEQQVKRNSDSKTIAESIERLRSSADNQLKAYSMAKDKPKATKTPDPTPAVSSTVPTSHNRWVAGKNPIIESEVLADPNQVVSKHEADLAKGFKSANENPRFVLVLEQVAAILYKNNRAAEAAKYQNRAAEIRKTLK